MPERTSQASGDDLESRVEEAGADFALKRRRDTVRYVLREMGDGDWQTFKRQLQASLKHPRAGDGIEILERVYRRWELLEDIDKTHPEIAHSSAKAMAFKTVDWIASDRELMERLERMNEALEKTEADMTREELRWALHRMPPETRQRVLSFIPPNTILAIKAKAAGKPPDKTNGLDRDRLLAEDFFGRDLTDEEAAESYRLTVNGLKATVGGILNALVERPLARKAAGEYLRTMVKIPIMGEQEVRRLMPRLKPGERDELMDEVPKHTWKDRSLIARDRQVVGEYFARTDWSVRRFAEEYSARHKGDPGFEGLKERSADQIISRMCAKIAEEPTLARKIRERLGIPEPILPSQRVYLDKLLRVKDKPAVLYAHGQDEPQAEARPGPAPAEATAEHAQDAVDEAAKTASAEPAAAVETKPSLAEIKATLEASLQPLKPSPAPTPGEPEEPAAQAGAIPVIKPEPAAAEAPKPSPAPPLPEIIVVREPPKPAEPMPGPAAPSPVRAPEPKPLARPQAQPKPSAAPPNPASGQEGHRGKKHQQPEQPVVSAPPKSPDELARETFDHTLMGFRGRYKTRVHMLEAAGIRQQGLYGPIATLSEASEDVKLGATRLIEYLCFVRVEKSEAALEPLTRHLRGSLDRWSSGVRDEDLARFAMQKVMASDACSGKWTEGKSPGFMDGYAQLGLDYEERSRKLPEGQYLKFAEAEELYREIAAAMLA